MKRLRAWARGLRAPIPLACYGLAFVFWLGSGLAVLGWESAGRAGGRLVSTALDPAALEQVDTDLRIVQTGQVSTEPSV